MNRIKQHGKFIWNGANKQFNKYPSFRFLTVLLCVTLLYCVMYGLFGGYFITGDDTEMMKNVSGYYTGKPSSYCQFLSTPLGLMYKVLYSWFPYTSWYSLFHVGFIILCVSIITYEIIEHLLQKKDIIYENIYTKFGSLLSIICYLAVIFAYPFYMLSFTVTAAFYAIAAVMLLLSMIRTKVWPSSYWKYTACFFLLTMSSLLRYDSFKAVFPFFMLTFGYIENWMDTIKIM